MTTMRKAMLFPYAFLLMNWAAVTGLYYFLRGYSGIWDAEGGMGERAGGAVPR